MEASTVGASEGDISEIRGRKLFMLRNKSASLAAALALVAGMGHSAFGADPQYKAIKEIVIGGLGGWDYLTTDPANHRLYLSHATKVVVIDTETDKQVGEIL